MKKILLAMLIAPCLANASQDHEVREMQLYRKGYSDGSHAVERFFNEQGFKQKKIIFKNYIVSIPIEKLAKNDIAFICDKARSYGYSPIVTQDRVVVADYDRFADANYNAEFMKKNINNTTVQTEKVRGKFFYTYPIFKDMYKKMEEEIKEANDVIVVIKYKNGVQKKCNKSMSVVGKKVEYFKIKDNIKMAQGYTYKNLTDNSPEKWRDNTFEPFRAIKDDDQLYRKGKTIKTINGVSYIKVYDKNLFFKKEKVKRLYIYI